MKASPDMGMDWYRVRGHIFKPSFEPRVDSPRHASGAENDWMGEKPKHPRIEAIRTALDSLPFGVFRML